MISNRDLQLAFISGFYYGKEYLDRVNSLYEDMEGKEPEEGELIDPYMRARAAALQELIEEAYEELEFEYKNVDSEEIGLTKEDLSQCKEMMSTVMRDGEEEHGDVILPLSLKMCGL